MNKKGAVPIIAGALLLLGSILIVLIALIMFKVKLSGEVTYEYRVSTLSPAIMTINSIIYQTHPGYEIIGSYFARKDSSQRLRDDSNTPSYVKNFKTVGKGYFDKIYPDAISSECYAFLKISNTFSETDSFIRNNCPALISGTRADVYFIPIALAYNNDEMVGLGAWVIQEKA